MGDTSTQNAGSGERLKTRFGRLLRTSEHILYKLYDPEYGHAGREFVGRLLDSGCAEEAADLGKNLPATFWSFNGAKARSYHPLIHYNEHQPRTALSVLFSRIHEGNHGIAWSRAAILHTSPYNTNASFCVMCPESFLILADLVERDAYAKQGWLGSLAAKIDPSVYRQTADDAVTAREFEKIRAEQGGDLYDALCEAARVSLDKWHKDAGTYANHYHMAALNAYHARLQFLRDNGIQPFFVRLEAEDVADAGHTYGPNIFAGRSELAELPALSVKASGKLQQIKSEWGIHARVTPFGQLLDMRGMDREDFLYMSKAWEGVQKTPTKAPGKQRVQAPIHSIAA